MMEKLLFPDLKRESMGDCDGNCGEEDDGFYEGIEAPKFVDFTVSDDRSRLDDPSWFCVRVGCDQMHEMVDPEALHRSFVLRVMAARSPNVKLRKLLYKQQSTSSTSTPKCPKSAPQKPANDRVLKFSRITSVHEKTCIDKIKEHPISSLRSTPKKLDKAKPPTTPKVRQTPKNQKSQGLAWKTTESSAAKNTPKFRICTCSKCATFDTKSCKQERTPLSVRKKKKNEEISKNVSVVHNVPLEYTEEDDDKENAPDNRNTSNMNLEKQQAQKEKSCKKMKPTNPKPFRLRTDERVILKEANLLERKLQNSVKKNITPMTNKQGDEVQSEKQQKMVKLATPSKMSVKKNTNMKGRKPTTIPKEPNFQRIHLPKGCTKRQEQQQQPVK